MSGDSTHAIIIANYLRTGRTVFFTKESAWSESIESAELLDAASADARLAVAIEDEGSNLVLDPCLVEANAQMQIRQIREQIRAGGPTILGPDHVAIAQAA